MNIVEQLDSERERRIDRLISHCQHLHDVAFDLDIIKDAGRIEVIDQTIKDLKIRIIRIREGID